MLNKDFNRLLDKRELNVEKLAKLTLHGRAHLTQVLSGSRRGTFTWKRLAQVLTKDEYDTAHSFALERQIVSAALDGEDWAYLDAVGVRLEKPELWPETITEAFLAEKKIEVLSNPIAQH